MPKLSKLLGDKLKQEADRKPLWEGPYSDGKNGGLTQGLISRFLVCRHKFWIRTVLGLKQDEGFDYKLEYGNAWHYCEELLAAKVPLDEIKNRLFVYCKKLSAKHSFSSNEVDKLYNCCRVQFPIYVDYWKKNEDVKARKPLEQEQVFKIAYTLPDGRTVYLTGKIDAADILPNPHGVKGIYIQENKSKSDFDVQKLVQDLPTDLQTMMYNIAAREKFKGMKLPIHGARYNVVRRPLSGQRYNIKQKTGLGKAKKGAETKEEFYSRLGEVIRETAFDKEGKPREHSDFFVRFKVDVSDRDIETFKKQCLNPILTQICDWWDSIQGDPFDPWHVINEQVRSKLPNHYHFLYPSGVYNPMLEGRSHVYDEYVQTGRESGLERSDILFPELEPVDANSK